MNTELMLSIATIIFASTGFWQFASDWIKQKSGKKTKVEKAVLALLRDKLYYLCDKHIHMHYISVSELDNLDCLYRSYEELGGNSVCKQLYQDVQRLPKRKEHK